MPPGFSIVLCTFNGSSRLTPTLAHIAALTVPENHLVELILVDNASTDNTADFTLRKWESLGNPFPLVIVEEKRPGKGYAVETGYDRATYSYILTVDDDNWLKQDYLVQSVSLLTSNPAIGVLQGKSEGVFEVPPPAWVNNYLPYFIIGGPRKQNGFFPPNNAYVWGAGMVIKNEDWKYVRSKGFSFLTGKTSGKAAGEDNETAMVLLILGRKIYYSDTLQYKHYMPESRIDWNKLEQNFETFGYVRYHVFLYLLVLESFHKKYTITESIIKRKFFLLWLRKMRGHTLKIYYRRLFFNEKSIYNLQIKQNMGLLKWGLKLSENGLQDIKKIQSWMYPLLKEHPDNFFIKIQDT